MTLVDAFYPKSRAKAVSMQTVAVVMREPKQIALERVDLIAPNADDVTVDIEWSGISSGTERLLWQGRMPHFPGMGYPLVPGYESVGRVTAVGPASTVAVGADVFIPGTNCFQNVKALFGGSARRVVINQSRIVPLHSLRGPEASLLALAATAYHAAPPATGSRPDLIIGHGVVGRLLARLAMLDGGPPPVVWETVAARRDGAHDYPVVDPTDDTRRNYRCICDASGDASLLDTLIQRLAPGGEIILAGFYSQPLSFNFPPAFMREARLRVAAQFLPADLIAVRDLAQSGRLRLDGLVSHQAPVTACDAAYRTAFEDTGCLKMVLDWRQVA